MTTLAPHVGSRVDLLYGFEAEFTDLVGIGAVPEGFRLDLFFEGRATRGELAGAAVRGIDYLLLRPNGVGVLDVREVLTRDGVAVEVRAGGYSIPPAGFSLPDPQLMLAPDFVWPDLEFALHGFATFRTAAAEWQQLNETVAMVTGAANPGGRRLVIEAKAFRTL